MFDIALGLAHRVLLTKLVELDGHVCWYLDILTLAALAELGETLVMPEGMQITMMTREAFEKVFLNEYSHNFDNYRLLKR